MEKSDVFLGTDGCIRLAKSGLSSSDFKVFLALAGVIDRDNYSRFYPPHKSSAEYGKYHGTITVMIGDSIEDIHEHKIEATTLDELKELTEKYVSEILGKIHNAIKSVF